MIELNCIKSLNGANGKFDLDVNLNVKKGEFVALYGKSGSGTAYGGSVLHNAPRGPPTLTPSPEF